MCPFCVCVLVSESTTPCLRSDVSVPIRLRDTMVSYDDREVTAMAQQGQVFPLAAQGRDGTRWAYRYRVGGAGSRRVQRGGFASEQAAEALRSQRP
jgi:hypothetical protein